MKSVTLLLPTLLEMALVLALHSQAIAPRALTSGRHDADICELRSELKSITARLDAVESEGQQFVPRGGLTTDAVPHPITPATTEAGAAPAH